MLKKIKRGFPLPAAAALLLGIVLSFLARAGAPVPAFNDENAPDFVKVPIVMYHHICKDEKLLGKYVISPSELESDLLWIKEHGYTPIFVSDLLLYAEGGAPLPEKPIILTFDDGYESVFVYVHPLLKEYEMKAVVSVIGVYSELYSNTKTKHINYSHLTWDQIKEMDESGLWEIGNHSYDKHNLKKERRGIRILPGESDAQYKEAISDDVIRLQTKLFDLTGRFPTLFTYPFGYISRQSDDVLRDLGFKATLACGEGINKITGGEEELYRLKRYNRPHNINNNAFFDRICEEDAK